MLALLLLLAATDGSILETDFAAQVHAGKMLCSNPDISSKTCSTIAKYTQQKDDIFSETAELLIAPKPSITLEMFTVARFQGSVSCGSLQLSEMQQGKLRVDGELLAPDRNEVALGKIIEKLGPMAGKKTCDGLRFEAGQLMKYGQVDGIDVNLPGKPVRWIAPEEGYRVAPR